MNFTASGLALVKTPEFLLRLQLLPQNHEAFFFLAIAACSEEDGTLVLWSEDEPVDFIETLPEAVNGLDDGGAGWRHCYAKCHV